MDSVLEVLQRAEATLSDEGQVFNFHHWCSCTCGHIYAASRGVAPGLYKIEPGREEYAEVITRVAYALGWDGVSPTDTSAIWAQIYVSKKTCHARNARGGCDRFELTSGAPKREDALSVVRDAIAQIQEMEEGARLEVLREEPRVLSSVG